MGSKKNYFKVTKATLGSVDLAETLKALNINTDEARQEILNMCGETGVEIWKNETQRNGFVDTGSLMNSYKAHIEGDSVLISPDGTNQHDERNGEVAFILHYGRQTQKPTHWVDVVQEKLEAEVTAKAKEIVASKMKG